MTSTGKIAIGSISAAIVGVLTYFLVGTGSDKFSIDGSKTKYKAGDTIRVKPGVYGYGEIKNIWLDTGYVYIIGDSVELKGDTVGAYSLMNIGTLKGVVISGFYIHKNRYRGIQGDDGKFSNLTFKNIRFDDIRDYTISLNDGTGEVKDNIKILNCNITRCQQFSFGGHVNKDGTITGLLNNLEVAYNYVHNCPTMGAFVWVGAANNYDLHHNTIDGVNQLNNNHNGIFCVNGSGKIRDNKLTNHQGNLCRAWGFKIGTTPGLIEITNNIVFNSLKYGAFELQVPPVQNITLIVPGKTTYCNAKVNNNTAGQLNTSHDWDGGMLDLYNIGGGSLEYYNNLGFDMWFTKGVPSNMINNMSDVKVTQSNNIYKVKWQDAVADLTTFKSLFPGVGANSTDTKVYYNTALSTDFTRNNCQTGWTGSKVIYIVPAGKYSSKVSQQDADAMAKKDIEDNGQNYANTNGICTAPAKKITATITVYSDGSIETKQP